ncbi:hypothetical protein OHB39_21330 [Streptomyces sp. NBC_00047]|nr:hypothetical protein [Streptomyces sp. NBC_00047]
MSSSSVVARPRTNAVSSSTTSRSAFTSQTRISTSRREAAAVDDHERERERD